jgi:DNA (cytosine-5)-methyltransferase 1
MVVSRPKLLDAYCGGGGAGMGYSLAGFDVTGVDIKPQPRYPFAFHQADAVEFIREHGYEFDAIHASPPCQAYSAMQRAVKGDHPDLVAATRSALVATGRPWAIENVEGAPLRNYVTLCGTMFGLRVRRHRLFELSPMPLILCAPCSCTKGVTTGRLIGHRVAGRVAPGHTKPPHHTESDRREAIGVPWMTARGARQAIPPAYTRFIGAYLLDALTYAEQTA